MYRENSANFPLDPKDTGGHFGRRSAIAIMAEELEMNEVVEEVPETPCIKREIHNYSNEDVRNAIYRAGAYSALSTGELDKLPDELEDVFEPKVEWHSSDDEMSPPKEEREGDDWWKVARDLKAYMNDLAKEMNNEEAVKKRRAAKRLKRGITQDYHKGLSTIPCEHPFISSLCELQLLGLNFFN